MFKWLKKDSEKIQEKVPCACDANNEYCDLISRLSELQKTEKELKEEIETLSKDRDKLILNFTEFIELLDKYGYRYNFNDRLLFHIVKDAVDACSSADIFRIAEELKTYKDKSEIIIEKEMCLKTISNEIKDIKDNLGIK